MKQKTRLLFFSSLLFFSLFLYISITPTSAFCSKIEIGAISAQGNIAVNETITLQVTVLNRYGSSKTRDIGLALPPIGLANHTPLLVEDVIVPGDSYTFVNFTISINSTGDFELLVYEMNGYGIGDWKAMHLIVGAFPEDLPTTIIVNETILINETIPVDIEQTINVTNIINNYNNYSILVNDTDYNTIVNTITNQVYNTFIVNITQHFNYTQWQEQWQWQNVTVILPAPDIGENALLLTLAGTGILGVFFMGVAPQATVKKRKIKGRKVTYEPVVSTFGVPRFDRRFKFGLATLASVITVAALIFYGLPTWVGFDLLFAVVWGFLIGAMLFVIIMSINHPMTLLALPPLIDIGLWLWHWVAGLIALVIILAVVIFWVAYSRHKAYRPRYSYEPPSKKVRKTQKGMPPF